MKYRIWSNVHQNGMFLLNKFIKFTFTPLIAHSSISTQRSLSVFRILLGFSPTFIRNIFYLFVALNESWLNQKFRFFIKLQIRYHKSCNIIVGIAARADEWCSWRNLCSRASKTNQQSRLQFVAFLAHISSVEEVQAHWILFLFKVA